MSHPTNLEEYNERFFRNQDVFGHGVLETGISMPCPFCAAAAWLTYRIIETEDAMKRGATCSECGRSARALFTEPGPGAKQFEFVQTGGPDQPEWLPVKMRRVET